MKIFNLRLGAELGGVERLPHRTRQGSEGRGSLWDDAWLHVCGFEARAGESLGRAGPGHRTVDVGFLSWAPRPKRPSAAAALRAAQIAIWREGRWQAPYYWAGFVLQGEPK